MTTKGEEERPYQNVDAFSDVGIAVGAMAIDIEKLLCKALGIAWQPTGMGVESLILRLQEELKEAREKAALAIAHVGDGPWDIISSIRSQTIEECAKIAEEMNYVDNTCYDIAKAIRSLDSNGAREAFLKEKGE